MLAMLPAVRQQVADIHALAQAVSTVFWFGLTWTIFITGYLLKATLAPVNIAGLLAGYVLFSTTSLPLALTSTATFVTFLLAQASKTCKAQHQTFLDLGPGGTPSTFSGFKRITLLAWFGRINVLEASSHDFGFGFLAGYLDTRQGDRPIIGGIAPQRQLDQRDQVQSSTTS